MEGKKPLFGKLFKFFRLRSGMSTISEFSSKLVDEGIIFEDSLFSRWQNGSRIPKDRRTILKILKIFIDNSGISSLKEANAFLESAGQGYLTSSELDLLPMSFVPNSVFQVPAEVSHFTGREYYVDRIKEHALNGEVILVHGPAGIGKTSLAIRAGYLLRQEFPDGILWYRLDTSSAASILASIARSFGENVNEVKDVEIRASIVRSLLSSKKILLILDNAELESRIDLLIPNSVACSVLITSRNKNLPIPTNYSAFLIERFTQDESITMFRKILGRSYVERNKVKISEMADALGNLPLAVSFYANQIHQSSKNIRVLYGEIKKKKMRLEALKYEDSNFYTSMNTTFKNLEEDRKKIFISLCVFGGKDFSMEAVVGMHKLRQEKVRGILDDLINKSLVERSVIGRYRLHPLIKFFAQQNISSNNPYLFAANYYVCFMKKPGHANTKFYSSIEVEQDNIIFIFNKCYELKLWDANIKLWGYLGPFLWNTGQWDLVDKIGQKVYRASLEYGDDYSKALCSIRELSWLYYWQGDLELALKWAKEGLNVATMLGNSYLIAYAKQRLGKIYQGKQQNEMAEKLLRESAKIFKELKENERLGDTLTYLGEQHVIIGDLKKGEGFLNEALRLTEEIKDVNQNAIVLGYLGEINYLKKNYLEARKCFVKSLAVADIKEMNVGGKVWCNIGLALLEQQAGNNREAHALVQRTQEYIVKLGIKYDGARPLMVEYRKLLNNIHFRQS